MCGIAGFVNIDGQLADVDLLRKMTRTLSHRGPDGEGVWTCEATGLGHRRLTIIDLSENGSQPMCNETEKVCITFNGEIYNYRELRLGLQKKGHHFRSTTDTEVIIHLYEEYGTDCVNKLNGMFAFAIWDTERKSLFLARDRLGIKPLFFCVDQKRFRFSSEIKAILADPGFERIVDSQGFHNFLSLNYTTAPLTLFRGLRQLMPAHCLLFENGKLREWRYWDMCFDRQTSKSNQEWIDEFEDVLEESVERHLVSDVSFGALLSGGVDSSAVVALMSEKLTTNLKTFTIGFNESSFNEVHHARKVAQACKTDHMEKILEPRMAEVLPKIVWHSEEPLADPSSLPMFYLAQMVSERVKMVLGGDGADELLAGYETYQADHIARLYRIIPRFLRQWLVSPIVESLPVSYKHYSFDMKAKRFVRAASLPPDEAHFSWRTIFDEERKHALVKESILGSRATFEFCRHYFDRVPEANFLNRMLYFDTCFHLPNDILAKVDRMSMAHGLEVRVPFLDVKVVECAARIPPGLKLRWGMKKKFILKEAMKRRLPSGIVQRRKAGFNVPVGAWLKTDLREMLCDLLSPSNLRQQDLLEEKTVGKLIDDHFSGVRDNGFELWGLLVLMVWWESFFKGDSSRVL